MTDATDLPSGRRRAMVVLLVIAAGALVTWGLSALSAMGVADALRIAGVAAGAALAAGLVGLAATRAVRRRSVGTQAAIGAFTAVGAVAAGAVVAAKAMFLSRHDLDSLLVLLAAAVTAGVVVALAVGWRVQRAAESLQAATRSIGGTTEPPRIEPSTPKELAAVARELEAMRARLADAQARERRVDSARRELVAWVSHDLRTPLAGIRAMAEALEDAVASDPALVARYHRTIRTETERLSELVDELFELSVIQAGALQVKLEVVSLADLVSEAIAAEGPAARAGRVRLESRVDRAPLEIRLAPTHVGRALRNLLENAIRHTPSDGSVSVEAGVDRDEAFVAVQDECGGIPLPDLDRVFETAFRGGAARTPAGGGRARAGLGLAIARGIVEAHRGAITVRNLNGGCRFEMRLPSPKAAP